MKILVAIETADYKKLPDTTLRWVGRLSFDVRVFAPKNKRTKFLFAVDDANYQWYLALNANDTIVTRTSVDSYALQHGYDLIVRVPEDLVSWNKRLRFKDDEVLKAYTAITNARGEFSRRPQKRTKKFVNGVVMDRVNKT